MKNKITPRDEEVVLREDDFIVSKTDISGRITYANREFMRIANFGVTQLLNQQHNIVRHPDMPRGVFRFMWQVLKEGQEFFGYVKNMTADGAFYWVFANITPDFASNGEISGYYSVRRKPTVEALRIVEPIYKEMLAVERATATAAAPDASIALLKDKLRPSGQDYEHFILAL